MTVRTYPFLVVTLRGGRKPGDIPGYIVDLEIPHIRGVYLQPRKSYSGEDTKGQWRTYRMQIILPSLGVDQGEIACHYLYIVFVT
jgi:hypothetical protein